MPVDNELVSTSVVNLGRNVRIYLFKCNKDAKPYKSFLFFPLTDEDAAQRHRDWLRDADRPGPPTHADSGPSDPCGLERGAQQPIKPSLMAATLEPRNP